MTGECFVEFFGFMQKHGTLVIMHFAVLCEKVIAAPSFT